MRVNDCYGTHICIDGTAKAQAVLFGCGMLGEWDSCGAGCTIHTNPGRSLQFGLMSLYVMLPLTPTPPTSQIILPVCKSIVKTPKKRVYMLYCTLGGDKVYPTQTPEEH